MSIAREFSDPVKAIPAVGASAFCWDAAPTGNFTADCETGRAFAIEFLKSCDGTVGWASLMGKIVTDMIDADTIVGRWPDGRPKSNGIVIGFMGVIGSALVHSRVLD